MVSRDDLNIAKLGFELRAPFSASVGRVVAQITQPQEEVRAQGLQRAQAIRTYPPYWAV